MKAILALLLAAGVVAHAADSAIPKKPPLESYDKLVENWPFALATAPVAPTEPTDSIFQNLFLGSAAKISEGGVEKDWVVIRDRMDNARIVQLFGNEPNEDGFQLLQVNWSDDPKKVTANIKKGDEIKNNMEVDQGAWGTTGPLVTPGGGRPPVITGGSRQGIPIPNGQNAIRPQVGVGTPQPRGQAIPRPGLPGPQAIKVNPPAAQAVTPVPRTRVIPSPR